MKFYLTIFFIFFCVYQLALAHVSDSESQEDEVNTYVQSVKDFWTDERIAQAKPKPM